MCGLAAEILEDDDEANPRHNEHGGKWNVREDKLF